MQHLLHSSQETGQDTKAKHSSESSNSPLGQDFRSLESSGLHDLRGIRTDLSGVMGYEKMTDTGNVQESWDPVDCGL